LDAPELETLLTPLELSVAERYFGITAQGNFIDHSHPARCRIKMC